MYFMWKSNKVSQYLVVYTRYCMEVNKCLEIKVDNLKVNPENYRFESLQSEKDAIKIMLKENNKN